MNDYVLKALCYIYNKQKISLHKGEVKGLAYKSIFDYNKKIDELANLINENKITDLEEVLSYGE